MADSLRASEAGLQRIDQARRAKRWHKTAEAWCAAAFTSRATLNRFWGGKAIRSETFIAICNAVNVDWQTVAAESELQAPIALSLDVNQSKVSLASQALSPTLRPPCPPTYDWGNAPNAVGFVGRETELKTLSQWLQDESCRLIVLLGLGGIGKTTLSVESARLHQQDFDCVIWRSLRNAPTPEVIIKECIATLFPEAVSQLPNHIDGLVNWLLKALQTRRCLLVLDNLESILQEGSRAGNYRTGFEGYGQLLRSVAEAGHQSQVVITSREMPKGIAAREGECLPVRCLRLQGLASVDSQTIFQQKGRYSGTEADWQALTRSYGGNPLALKILASAIRDFFGADVGQFLKFVRQEPFILDDIRDLIGNQFERLPELEQSVMFWLAINREPVSLIDLRQDFLDPPSVRELLQALASLQRRSLIEIQAETFTQQPVVMEYVISQIVDLACGEVITGGIAEGVPRRILETHALSKATSQDYIRDSQLNLIVKPILQQLLRDLSTPAQIEDNLRWLLREFQTAIKPSNLPSDNIPESSLATDPVPSYGAGNLLTLLCQMGADLTNFNFAGQAIWQANLQDYPLHGVDFTGSQFDRTVFTENLGNVLAAVFSPDGQTLATCDTDCTVRLWEAASGKLLRIFQGHTNWVRSVAFSPDGKTLASGGADHTVRLWDVASGACLRICQGHTNEVFAVAVSADDQWVASGSSDRTVRLWENGSVDCHHVFLGHDDCVRTVTFCPHSITLVSGSDDGTIRLWDVHTQQCLQTIKAHDTGVWSIAIATGRSSDELLLASGGDNAVILWNAYTGQRLQTLTGHAANVYAVTFAPCRDVSQPLMLASGSGDHTIRVWNITNGQCLKTLVGHSNQVGSLSFAPGGGTLAAVSLDQTVRLWDVQSAQPIRTWTSHTDWVYPVAFNPDGQYLISGSNNGSVRVWNITQQTCRFTLSGHQDQVCSVAVCPENHLIASASRDRTIRLWDLHTGKCDCILRGHTDWVYTVAFSPTLKAPSGFPLLASGGADATLRLWDCHTGECLQILTGHHGQVWDVAFGPTEHLATAGADHTIRIWDAATGACLQVLHGHGNRVYSVAFQPLSQSQPEDTEVLVSGSSDTTLKSWHWRTGDCLETYIGHTNWIFSVACAPDGRTFASGAHDRTVRIWDAATGRCRYCCTGHEHLVSSVAYSPDGQLIASGSQDQSVRLWDSQNGKCIGILRAPRLYEGMILTTATGLTAAQYKTLAALGAIV